MVSLATLGSFDLLLTTLQGWRCHVDSYSAFTDNGGFAKTDLQTKLQEHNITHVFLSGLAFDYCVFWSGKDSAKFGYKTYIIEDASRGIAEDTINYARKSMMNMGIEIISSTDIGTVIERIKNPSIIDIARNNYTPLLLIVVIVVLLILQKNLCYQK